MLKITMIHIYGFGQFEDKIIQLAPSDSLQLFYGQNEAGKSTIMAFLHAMFFGFPARNHAGNRHEPKTGAKYGGKVTLAFPDDKQITIERVAGRTSGELTIYDDTGNVSGDQEWQSLFKGLDRTLYQAIFSFSFKGLQAIEQVKATELSHYLFSAGASGGQALFELEKKIDKRLDELYKPSGKKPLLNEKLMEIEYGQTELKKWEEKIDSYNRLVDEKDSLGIEIERIDEKINQHQSFIREYEKKLLLQPHIQERKKWQIQLAQISDYKPFPVDGLERLQELQHEIRPLKAQQNALSMKVNDLNKEASTIHYHEHYINLEANVQVLKEKQKVYEMHKTEKEKIWTSLHYEQSEINNIAEKLGIAYSKNEIQLIDTSLVVKEQLKDLTTRWNRLHEQKQFLDEQFSKAKADLEQTEWNVERLKQEKKRRELPFFAMALASIVVIAGGLAAWLFTDSIYPLIIASVILIGILVNKRTFKNGKDQQLAREMTILQQKERLFDDILKQFEKWESEQQKVNHDVTVFCSHYKIPCELPISQLLNAFEWIEELKRRTRTVLHLQSELKRIETAINSFENDVQELFEVFANDNTDLALNTINKMIAIIETEKEQRQKYMLLNEKIKEYEAEISQLEQQISYFEAEITKLFESANVEDEEAFRKKGVAAEEYGRCMSQLQTVESYLQSMVKADKEQYIAELGSENIQYEQMIDSMHEEIRERREKVKQKQLRLADIAVEIKNLEEGTTYSELVHRFAVLKSEFEEEARQWAIYKVAKDLINRTKNFYREVRLPQVIQTAQHYFSFLTYGNYPLIIAPTGEKGFIVERSDGIRFEPNELSQATTEQLYLSLRLALASSFKSQTSLPILIDDSFVNFDSKRTKRALELIQEISTKHQILFFTCHKHIADFFDETDTQAVILQSTIE